MPGNGGFLEWCRICSSFSRAKSDLLSQLQITDLFPVNWHHDPDKRAAVGMSGTGKSTLLLKLLECSPARWKFVFDYELECARKLNWQPAQSLEGLCRLLDNRRPVVYYPDTMFPDDPEAGLEWFCKFVKGQCDRKDGPKLFFADEIQEYVPEHWTQIQPSFRKLCNVGRRAEIDMLLGAQSITDLPLKYRRQITEIYMFKQVLVDTPAIAALGKLGITPAQVDSLPHPKTHRHVGWIHRDLLTGKTSKVIQPCT